MRILKLHLRKIGIIILNSLFNYNFFYKILGFINKKVFKGLIKTIFLFYPANDKYVKKYVYNFYARRMKWSPKLIGFFVQNKKIGIIFGISSSEDEILKEKNVLNLKKIENEMENFRKIVGAKRKTFAGILPSVFYRRGIINDSDISNSTVCAVIEAIYEVIKKEKIKKELPLIVIGGEGFVGKNVIKTLKEMRYREKIYSIDLKNDKEKGKLPVYRKGEKMILLNISKKRVLNNYLDRLWPGLIVLNEVYPEPSKKERDLIKMKGMKFYHIVGIKGFAFPKFPNAYKGGIPCCASFVPSNKNDYKIIIKSY